MKHTIVSVMIGVTSGIGFSWILNHVPSGLAMLMAVTAVIVAVAQLWRLQRSLRSTQQEIRNSRAELARLWQRLRAGDN